MMREQDFLNVMRGFIVNTHEGSQAAASIAWGVSPQYVSMVVNGRKPPTALMLQDMGFARHKSVVTTITYEDLR